MPAGSVSCLEPVPAVRSCPPQTLRVGFSGSISQNGGMVPCSKYRMYPGNCISASRAGGAGGRMWGSRKRAEEVLRRFLYRQTRRETNNAENRKTDVLGNDGSIPRAPAQEGGTSSVISGSHELQLLHSAPILQPDVFECSFSPSCRDTALAVPPCSGTAPHMCLGAVPGPLTSREGFPREQGRGQESSLSTAVLYPVVFLPGLLQFPALSYLEQGRQRSPVLWLRACPRF